MGKSLRGKECGKGICQRKDGLYYARFGLSCVILFLSTGEQESQRRTVPMIPTYISSAMKQGSNTFVCTPCDIPMLQEQSKAVCSRRCCKNCWVMKTTMDRYVHVTAESLDYAIKQFQQNGVV